MKNLLKRIAVVGLGLGISLAGVAPAYAATLTWAADQTIQLDDSTITVKSGSEATSLIVGVSSFNVIIAEDDVFTITSTGAISVTGNTGADVDSSCSNGTATVVITGGDDNETMTISGSDHACSSSSSGGGGGGGKKNSNTETPSKGDAHSAGSVVKSSDGTVWFITTDGHRRAFTSGGAFLSYGFLSWGMVQTANEGDLELPTGSFIPPQDGKIICSDRDDSYAKKGTCYLITAGKRAAFTSSAVFTGQGFKFSRATTGDVSFMTADTNISSATAAHRQGVLINNAGTIQLVGPSSLMGIPSQTVFGSWGYSFEDTVPANAADKAMSQSGVMPSYTVGQLSPL